VGQSSGVIKSVYLYSLRRAGLWVGDFLVFVTWISLGNSHAHIGGDVVPCFMEALAHC